MEEGESSAPKQRRALFRFRFQKKERRSGYKQLALLLTLSLVPILLARQYAISTGVVTDVSMLPTLVPGRYLIILKYPYLFRHPRRGEIVVIRSYEKEEWEYLKRIIGLPEETLQIAQGRVAINGKPYQEPYVLGSTLPDLGPIRLAPGMYFLLGDNREKSQDSRHFGPIPEERIEGKINP